MNFIDCLLLTIGNVAICLAFPKLLSLALAPKIQQAKSTQPALTAPVVESKAPSFLQVES